MSISYKQALVFFQLPIQTIKEAHKLSLLARVVDSDDVGVITHNSMNWLGVADHINWNIPELTCV